MRRNRKKPFLTPAFAVALALLLTAGLLLAVNGISRQASAGRLSAEEALQQLKALDMLRKTPAGFGALGAAAVCAARPQGEA